MADGSYDSGLRELVHLLKFEQVRPAAVVLGGMLAKALAGLESVWTERPVVVVPVPLHARKLRQHGFNQAELIAQHAVKLAGGIRAAKEAVRYLVMVNEVAGEEWLTPALFRFGASSLLNDLLLQRHKLATGAYDGPDYVTVD